MTEAATEAEVNRRQAVAGFMAFGLFWGAWGAVLPAVRAGANTTDGELGVALLMIGFGALVSMRLTGRLVDRFGAGVLPVVLVAFGAAGVLPALAGSPVALAASLFLLGAVNGVLDVVINFAGVHAETGSGPPVMNLVHAWFSLCVAVSSLGTAGLRVAGAGRVTVLGLVAAAITVCALVLTFGPRGQPVRRKPRAAPEPRGPAPRRGRWLPELALLVFGGLGALAYLMENAWQSWGAVFLETGLGAGAGLSSTVPAVFATAVAAGRFTGNALTRRFAPYRVLRAGALLAAAGTLVAATAVTPWAGIAGIAVAGLGSSVCAPTIISLAGAWAGPGRQGAAVSTVTTISYLGFLVGPAVVGLASSLTSLAAALAGVAALALLLAVLAPAARRARSHGTPSLAGVDRTENG